MKKNGLIVSIIVECLVNYCTNGNNLRNWWNISMPGALYKWKILNMPAPFFLLFVFAIIQYGCTQQHEKKNEMIVDANFDNSKTSIYDVFSKIEIIPLETKNESLINSVDKISIVGEHIYILDKKMYRILIFNSEGVLTGELSRRGDGPDCYPDLEDFYVDPKTLNISTLSAYGKYNVYDNKGLLVSHSQIPYQAVHYFFPINSDLTALYTKIKGGRLLIYSIKQNKIIKDIQMSEEFILRKTAYHCSQSPFREFNNELLFLAADQKNIYKVTKEGKIEELYSFHFGKNDYNTKNLPKDEPLPYYYSENKDLKKIYFLSDYAETKDWMMLYYMYDRNFNSLFISKKDKNRFLFNKKNEIQIYYPFCVKEESIYSIIDMGDLRRIIKKEWMSETSWKKLDELSNEPNPIMIKYYLK